MLNLFLNGRYKIIQTLGEGGLAQTYIAEDHHKPSHPKCAVKFLKPASQETNFLPIARRLFNKEAEILEKLGEHSQIPRLLAYFEENQEFYLVQEFIDGYTLNTELQPENLWSESKVILMLQDVLQILEFVHSYGVIHRDIKPDNLIRRQKDGRLVLIDFGAVKEVSNLRIVSNAPTSIKTIPIGTQGYMPTEQVRGKPRLNSDIYALGMVGIQALTGVDPINLEEDNDGEVIWRNRAKVSDLLADILSKMVRYHFKDRYQSAKEVLEALQSLTNEQKSTQLPIVTQQINPQSFDKVEFQETKVALGIQKPLSHAIAHSDYQKTKVALNSKLPISSVTSSSELPATKVLEKNNSWISWNKKAITNQDQLEKKQSSSELTSQSELQETRISLGTKQLTEKLVTQPINAKTKIVLDSQSHQLATLEVASHPPKKINFELSALFTVFKNLDLSFIPSLLPPQKFPLLTISGAISIFLGLLASYNYFNYRKAYLQAEQTLKQIEELKVAENYSECIQQAQVFPQDYTDLNSKLNILLLECRQGEATAKLAEAKKLVEQSNYQNAIALVAQIAPDMTAYGEAQTLIEQWSNQIWQIAINQYQEGKLEAAKAIANSISNNSSLTTKVQTTISQWEQEWQQNQTYLATAQKAIKESRWQDAINAANQISDHPYWQKQSQTLIQQAKTEIKAIQIAKTAAKKTDKNPRSKTYPTSTKSYPSQTTTPSYQRIPRSLPLLPLPSRNSSSVNSSPNSSTSKPPSEWICLNNPNPKCKK